MLSLGAHFAAGGLMSVVWPWLIAHELRASDALVGFAQMAATLPMMLLVLVGGANADGRNLPSYIARLQLSSALLPIVLAVLVASHVMNYVNAIACIFTLGVVAAFILPARDSLLSHVSPPSLGLASTAAIATGATFGGQLVGAVIGASASTIGAVPLLCLQGAMLAVAAMLTARIPFEPPHATPPTERERLSRLRHELADGIMIVARNERLRTVILYLVLGAPLFNGMFLVGFPLMVRDVYHGSAEMLSTLITSFLIGLTISSFAFSRARPVKRPGRLLLLLTLNNIFVFTLAHFAPPFPYFAALMLWWGLVSGISLSLTRGMVQMAAPHVYRARVLSMLQFANVAGGPPGSLIYGLLSQAVGILNALLIVPVAVGVLWICFRFFSPLWHFRHDTVDAEARAPLS